jgi:hypothetical protein
MYYNISQSPFSYLDMDFYLMFVQLDIPPYFKPFKINWLKFGLEKYQYKYPKRFFHKMAYSIYKVFVHIYIDVFQD